MRSKAKTVDQYLAALQPDRREAISMVRKMILKHLQPGFAETMNWGMIAYEVPLATYPKTYNGQPLTLAGLGSQKQYCVLHLMCVYMNEPLEHALRAGFEKAGKKLNMGKACIRFKRADDLALPPIGKLIASITPKKWIAIYEASRKERR